jgi:hypothetical protein
LGFFIFKSEFNLINLSIPKKKEIKMSELKIPINLDAQLHHFQEKCVYKLTLSLEELITPSEPTRKPPNSYFLFKRDYRAKNPKINLYNSELSKAWEEEPEETKTLFRLIYDKYKAVSEETYPGKNIIINNNNNNNKINKKNKKFNNSSSSSSSSNNLNFTPIAPKPPAVNITPAPYPILMPQIFEETPQIPSLNFEETPQILYPNIMPHILEEEPQMLYHDDPNMPMYSNASFTHVPSQQYFYDPQYEQLLPQIPPLTQQTSSPSVQQTIVTSNDPMLLPDQQLSKSEFMNYDFSSL